MKKLFFCRNADNKKKEKFIKLNEKTKNNWKAHTTCTILTDKSKEMVLCWSDNWNRKAIKSHWQIKEKAIRQTSIRKDQTKTDQILLLLLQPIGNQLRKMSFFFQNAKQCIRIQENCLSMWNIIINRICVNQQESDTERNGRECLWCWVQNTCCPHLRGEKKCWNNKWNVGRTIADTHRATKKHVSSAEEVNTHIFWQCVHQNSYNGHSV